MLRDSIRGVDKELRSNLTDSEYSAPSFFTSFDFNGFTLSGSIQDYNSAANTYVAWNWKESATSGFDIVAYI
ncbi:MAG: hypothetical protein H6767_03930 [Candidatus Peribacteria bacterium]|nr:MAG: hypothetical protein H6767_03930 [Candidatus Peribacteria bacterium]